MIIRFSIKSGIKINRLTTFVIFNKYLSSDSARALASASSGEFEVSDVQLDHVVRELSDVGYNVEVLS